MVAHQPVLLKLMDIATQVLNLISVISVGIVNGNPQRPVMTETKQMVEGVDRIASQRSLLLVALGEHQQHQMSVLPSVEMASSLVLRLVMTIIQLALTDAILLVLSSMDGTAQMKDQHVIQHVETGLLLPMNNAMIII